MDRYEGDDRALHREFRRAIGRRGFPYGLTITATIAVYFLVIYGFTYWLTTGSPVP